jgi:proline racemase/trans-L-3-hydroxyproline dehydratase
VRVAVEDGRVGQVSFQNVPSYVEAEGLAVEGLEVDVAFGGAFYASVRSPLPVEPASLPRLIELGREVKRALEAERDWVHPLEPELRDVYGVIFWQDEGPGCQRNVTVFADGEVDRSPCGSGTSARLALLDARGELDRGAPLRHLSVVGSEFEGRVVGEAEVAGRPAVVTEVSGTAHLTGYHQFVLQDEDELGTGFLLR